MIATTAAHVLQDIAEHGDADARLDRWHAETGLSLDSALDRLLDCPPPPPQVRDSVLRWYLTRARPDSLAAITVAMTVLELEMNIPPDLVCQGIAESLAISSEAAGAPAPHGGPRPGARATSLRGRRRRKGEEG